MKIQRPLRGLFAGVLCATGVSFVSPASAGNVTVTEGETAKFNITVTRTATSRLFSQRSRIRVYYSAAGGTATPGFSDHGVGVDGADLQYLNPWLNWVQGRLGESMTISVRTHRDDLVEGDETVKIKVDGIRVPYKGWWHDVRASDYNFTGLPTTIIIEDATPAPAPAAPPPINWSGCYWSSC